MTHFNVFYHFPCNDGEIARLVWEQKYPESTFYKWNHGFLQDSLDILNKLPSETTIIFLDTCPSLDKLSENYNYIIIDHHKNAIDEMKKNLHNSLIEMKNYKIQLFCDITKSGCMLTWNYCFPKTSYPKLVHYIGSKDIWDFTDINTEPYTSGYCEYLTNVSQSIRKTTNEILLKNDTDRLHDTLIELGKKNIERLKIKAIGYFNNIKISTETVDNIYYNIIDIVCDDSTIFKYLCEYTIDKFREMDVLRILHTIKEDRRIYSVRSLKDHINVDGIARLYGGNGHPKAAGYTIIQ
jgi:oligoribonuclease NrnB/cAMP/cGMP phosphodiesterase (DHH superfamily)